MTGIGEWYYCGSTCKVYDIKTSYTYTIGDIKTSPVSNHRNIHRTMRTATRVIGIFTTTAVIVHGLPPVKRYENQAPIRIELMHNGFADHSLTAWVRRRVA